MNVWLPLSNRWDYGGKFKASTPMQINMDPQNTSSPEETPFSGALSEFYVNVREY